MSFVKHEIDRVIDRLDRAWDDIYGELEDAINDVWDYVVVPIFEEIFSWIGIEGEFAVYTSKSSSLIFGNNEEDVVKAAAARAVIAMVKTGGSFSPWYNKETRLTKMQIKSFYRFAKAGKYVHGLPFTEVKGGGYDYDAIDTALDIVAGEPSKRLTSVAKTPTDDEYFYDVFRHPPYNYLAHTRMMSAPDVNGVFQNYQKLVDIVYIPVNDNYEINLTRETQVAQYFITGPLTVVEGNIARFRIECNRVYHRDTGTPVTVNLIYGGTAVNGVDFIGPASITIGVYNSFFHLDLLINENTNVNISKTLTVVIHTIDDPSGAQPATRVAAKSNATVTILDDDQGIVLTMDSIIVWEGYSVARVPIKLEKATAGPFSVELTTVAGTSTPGIDYVHTVTTLQFQGYANEIQNFDVALIATPNSDFEYFTIAINSCSDPAVIINQTCRVMTTDGSYLRPAEYETVLSTFTMPGYIKEHSLVVTYQADTDRNNQLDYWVYRYSDETYPDIQSTNDTITDLSMLPVAILRRDKVFVDSDKESPEYLTTRALLNKVGMNIDDLIASAGENEFIGDVDDMYVNFAVSPSESLGVQIVSKALWISFHNMVITNAITSTNNRFHMIFTQQDVNATAAWTDHKYTPVVIVPELIVFPLKEKSYEHTVTMIPEVKDAEGLVIQEAGSVLRIRKRTSLVTVEQLEIFGLNGMSTVTYDGFHKVAVYKIDQNHFTIPMSFYILDQLKATEQMELFQHMFRIDTTAIQIEWLEFYETDAFWKLFNFVMIVVTIVTLGATSWYQVLMQLAINYLIIQFVIFLAEVTGNAELAAIIGLVAAIALSQGGFSGFDFASPEMLLGASTNFANNLTAAYDVELQEIGADLKELNESYEARMAEIDEARPDEQAIDSDFLVMLNSVDTGVFPAIKAQYDFDLLYNYDRLIADYYEINLRTGVL